MRDLDNAVRSSAVAPWSAASPSFAGPVAQVCCNGATRDANRLRLGRAISLPSPPRAVPPAKLGMDPSSSSNIENELFRVGRATCC
jgi:hypothetical protein